MDEKDFEECEWKISENENEIVSNVKKVATDSYNGTNVRVDQFGPYRISFRTKDSKDNRLKYEEISEIAKPLQEYLELPIYIGGSHSPLSKKEPNSNSDIDIYVITSNYDYNESKNLEKRIKEFILNKRVYDKCSIGQVESNWLELPYFYESVPVDEDRWWKLSENEINEELLKRREKAIINIKSKTKKDIIKEIESVYGIKVKEEDIVNIVATPRWKSINDSSFRRGAMIKKIEEFDIGEIIGKSDEWLVYENEETTLYDAVKNSKKGLEKEKTQEQISVYLNYSEKNGKYWLYNSILNAFAEAFAIDSPKINWILDSVDEETRKNLENQISSISEQLSNYYNKSMDNNFDGLKDFFERNNYSEKVEEFKDQYRKYRKICDLDSEVKLYLYNKLNKTNRLFIINPERKVGKMLKHSGLKLMIPFLNKELKDLNECPEYAKVPPSGYCQRGAINLMFGEDSTYNCDCHEKESEILRISKKAWNEFNQNIEFKESEVENKRDCKNNYSIVDKSQENEKEKAVILFGAPSIDVKNLLLIKTAEVLSKDKNTVIVEDIMAPNLYKSGVYDVEKIHRLYKSLENKKTSVEFTSQDKDFVPMVEEWMKKLTVKELKHLSPLTDNSNVYGFHVYDALHLAIMGATYEKVKDKTSIVHSYNETALHIFNKLLNKKDGYVSCHNIPGKINDKDFRLLSEDDARDKMSDIKEVEKLVSVDYKDKNHKYIKTYNLVDGYIYDSVKSERDEEIER